MGPAAGLSEVGSGGLSWLSSEEGLPAVASASDEDGEAEDLEGAAAESEGLSAGDADGAFTVLVEGAGADGDLAGVLALEVEFDEASVADFAGASAEDLGDVAGASAA